MSRMHRYPFMLFTLCFAISAAVFPVRAEPNNDQNRALEAVQRGEALSLSEVLARVQPHLGGEIIGISFERRDERWVYEFRLVAADGEIRLVLVDAKTATVISHETN
jgi:uncharacterized membrane protein YkoI